MEKYAGYFTFYWEAKAGKIWLEIDKWDTEFLYVNSLPAGVGSNDIGLDRGQLDNERIVKFQRVGPKVLLIQPNYAYRAISDNPDERRAVQEAFAQSVLWGFEVTAEENDLVLVDASDFYLRDAHDVIGALKRTNQGAYKLDNSRSAFYLPRTKNFPQNTEVEVMLTFTGDSPGGFVRQVVPTPEAITVRQHHSFIHLPDDNYKPRAFDPRAGFFGISYMDYATPISEPIRKRFISRHRLQKQNNNAAMSEAVEPIIYYLDPGAPEPIRSALMEGAQWWNQAFEAAGYQNAFQVKLLPADADPMDVRYNVIQWVHRSTRGWSYGSNVTDPRTGEIIKGHVTLGSLRVRQDFLIAEGLLAPYEDGKPMSPAMQEMALARLRQLSAHEVGHTLGLSHNYAASVKGRASVMDYPHPLVKLNGEGAPDLSAAYAAGIGEWDKVTIAYGYQDFSAGVDEKKSLNAILQAAMSRGLIFVTDQDARPTGGAHPLAHLWDNGPNAVDELAAVMQVRRRALERFGERNIHDGEPLATLEEVLAPMYMYHRYQTEAVAKLVGGLNYTYAMRGDGQKATEMIPAQEQRRALEALLRTLQPEALALPERVLQLIPPRAYGYNRSRETFNTRTGLTFDPLAAVETAASMTADLLLHPERVARLIEYHARDNKFLGLSEVMDKLISATWKASPSPSYQTEIQRVVNNVVLYHFMSLANNDNAATQARAMAWLKLDELKNWLAEQVKKSKDEGARAQALFAVAQIRQFQENPAQRRLANPVEPPAGPPIGGDHSEFCGFDFYQ
ncbi:zinc-dependent metalloprotease [candidate division KSB1 bacterium]|nr:zinc-dependent metalloprotease [candidate division KSB1 bacterium]